MMPVASYCHLAMPGYFYEPTPWAFTAIGLAIIAALGFLDRAWLHKSRMLAFAPAPLFLITQALALWINLSSIIPD